MKQTWKRALSLFLCLVMCFSLLAVTAFASDEEEENKEFEEVGEVEEADGDDPAPETAEALKKASEEEETQEEAPGAGDPADTILYDGICGDGVTWTLNDKGVLAISGSGAMDDYGDYDDYINYNSYPGPAPWIDCVSEIRSISIGPGVTYIGAFAFQYCGELVGGVTIPGTVKEIGVAAFFGCSMNAVTVGNGTEIIGGSAFMYCGNLASIVLPGSVREINSAAFYECLYLTDITIPEGVTVISGNMFRNCIRLVSVKIPVSVTAIANSAFYGCTALESICYDGTEAQWDAIVIEDYNEPLYSGSVTIITGLDQKARIDSRSLYTEGNVGLNFYLTLPESYAASEGAYATLNGTAYTIPAAQNDGTYRFTYYVTAKEMRDEVVIKLFTADGTPYPLVDDKGKDVTEGYAFSAQAYFDLAKEQSTDEKLLTMLDRMSEYGMYAQVYFDHNAAAAVITDEMRCGLDAVTKDMLLAYAPAISVAENCGLTYGNATLTLRSETKIRQYFNIEEGSLSDYLFCLDGRTVTPVQVDSRYAVEIPNIAAKDLDKAHEVKVTRNGEEIVSISGYSALSYVYRVLAANGDGDGRLVDLVKGLYLYNQSADAYWHDS